MAKLTDEMLMAYIDGELDEIQAEEVRKAAEGDKEIRSRLEIFGKSASILQGVFDAPMQEPVPGRLLDTVMKFEKEPDHRSSGLMERLSAFFKLTWDWKPAYAIVASVAILIGAGMTHLVHTLLEPAPTQGIMAFNGEEFSRGLEITLSGRPFTFTDRRRQIVPISTFLDKSNRYCRQYEISMAKEGNRLIAKGVACRDTSGTWSTIVSVHPPTDGSDTTSETNYIPAGEEEITDIVFSEIMSSPPLSLDREAELINRLWARPPKPD